MNGFSRSHPAASLVYFVCVLLTAMLAKAPIAIVCIFVFSIISAVLLLGRKILKTLPFAFMAVALMSLINPLFSSGGDTLLFSFGKYSFTLEAILYGFFSSLALVSVFYWFWCLGQVLTDEKILYLFGRQMPNLSMLLSMTLGFIPRLKNRYIEIEEAQKSIYTDSAEKYRTKILRKLKALSILLGSSLESSLDTADSMRARGYGLGKRTSYSVYFWTGADTFITLYAVASFAFATISMVFYDMRISYYPTIDTSAIVSTGSLYYSIACLALCILPTIITVKEALLWQFSKSRI